VSLDFIKVDGFGNRQCCLRTLPMLPKAFGKCNPNKRLVVIRCRVWTPCTN